MLVGALLALADRHDMLPRGATVVVACSGGSDSVALLDLLVAAAPGRGLRLVALHVHHGLRAAADEEAAAVVALGARLGVPVEVARVEVRARAERERRGLQDAARSERYAALEAAAARLGATRVAIGHTADDQAETFLARALRGAGLRGLSAIPPRRGAIVRPLLELERAALVAHLRARGLPWSRDPSNADPTFERARLRAALAAEPRAATRALARAARNLREESELVDALLDDAWRRWVSVGADGQLSLAVEPLARAPGALARRLVGRAAERAGAAPGRAALDAVAALLLGPARGSRRLDLGGGVVVERRYDRLVVGRSAPGADAAPPGLSGLLRTREVGPGEAHEATDPSLRALFDADALPAPLAVRAWRPGDRLRPRGGRGSRKLSDLFVDAKVPRAERGRRPILVAGPAADLVLWVPGLRASAVGAPGPATRRLLIAEYLSDRSSV